MASASFFVAPCKPRIPPLWVPAFAGMTVRKGGVQNVRKPSSRLLLLLPSGLALRSLALRRLALCRLFCCRRASAALVTPIDALSAPLLTPLHAGGLRLGGCVSKGEARRGRQSEKGQKPSTRDHSRFNF